MSRNPIFRSVLVVALLLVAGMVVSPPPANACMGCTIRVCVEVIIVEVCACVLNQENELFDPVVVSFPEGDQEKPNRAEIGIYGYATTHIENGFECIVAMPNVPGISSVDSIVNYNTVTGEPLPGVTFTSHSAPASSAEVGFIGGEVGVGNGDPWVTFVSNITERVEDGIPNHFIIEVTLDGETTPDQLVRNLRQHGAFFTGSSTQGFPNGDHLFLKRMADFNVMALYPPKQPEEPFAPGTRLSPVLP